MKELISFSFNLGSQYICGDNTAAKLIIGAVGGVVGSWAIGAFFMVPYLIPTVIASVEEEVTKKNHSAMYFAVQAFATSIVGAIASSLIYNYLKLWKIPNGSFEWKCGVSLVPLIVSVFCIFGFFLCFKMPKKYSAAVIYDDIRLSLEKQNNRLEKRKNKEAVNCEQEIEKINKTNISDEDKKIVIAEINAKSALRVQKLDDKISENNEILNQKFDENNSKAEEEKTGKIEKESIIANVFLFILSVGIFGIVDRINIIKKFKVLGIKVSQIETVVFILGFLIPFVSIASDFIILKKLSKVKGISFNANKYLPIVIVSSFILPMWMNIVDSSIIDSKLNKLA